MSLRPIAGVRRVDHIGITVPDLDAAHGFFVDVLGCEFMYRLGPFEHSDDWMSKHLNVADRTVMRRLHFYRLHGDAIFEVFEYESDGQQDQPPLNSDVGGHHVALYVDDLDEAVASLHQHGLTVLGEPTSSTGPSAGQRWIYFLTPWGLQMELVCYPEGKAFDRNPAAFA